MQEFDVRLTAQEINTIVNYMLAGVHAAINSNSGEAATLVFTDIRNKLRNGTPVVVPEPEETKESETDGE